MTEFELLTVAEMSEADRRTVAGGTPGIVLMERAGAAVAAEAARRMPAKVLVLAGPGNNGGDGFVAARLLAEQRRDVVVALLGNLGALHGDAASAAATWSGPTIPLADADPTSADLVVDAIFGAGLSRRRRRRGRRRPGAHARRRHPRDRRRCPLGRARGQRGHSGLRHSGGRDRHLRAAKPAHVLLPGRALAGEIVLADIGISDAVIAEIGPRAFANRPGLWLDAYPTLSRAGHKYDRGHALVLAGGIESCGAARLAARAALRAGAGLVTLGAPSETLIAHAAALNAVMLRRADGVAGVENLLDDVRRNAVVLGPALGVGWETAAKVERVLASGRAAVLDADALTSFSGRADALAEAIAGNGGKPVVLTPHDGEFARLFATRTDVTGAPSKLERARRAAEATGAIIVLKGADTVVASPDGRAAIADNAPPDMATAGSGDVLSGIIGGLLAQNMPGFEAAAAGVWMHGAAGARFGGGLIAEDLPDLLPPVVRDLREMKAGGPGRT